MKKKKCPQCKNLIPVNAPTCLYCGRPNKFVTKTYVKRKWNKDFDDNKSNINKWLMNKYILIIFFIILIIFLYKMF